MLNFQKYFTGIDVKEKSIVYYRNPKSFYNFTSADLLLLAIIT